METLFIVYLLTVEYIHTYTYKLSTIVKTCLLDGRLGTRHPIQAFQQFSFFFFLFFFLVWALLPLISEDDKSFMHILLITVSFHLW